MSEEIQQPPESSKPVHLEEEMKRSYLDYAMSVIVGRALPDVRDGLKPVHRRVLYGMWESGNLSNRAYKKSARIVGDVMGKYHPHGDAAIYDTVVRMAQDFSMRYPLVDGQGNFGSIDGDNPAAMRYTEVRLTKLAEEMLRDDIDKETVPWVANYDGSELEPAVLPARLPNLLVNGSSGIAVGMATTIPPHNLTEVVAALELLIDKPDASLAELMERIPGPDFPTGGTIHGVTGIRRLRHRSRHHPGARQGRGRGAQGRPPRDRGHRDPLPGQQGAAARAHRRAGAREEDRRHLRPPRRVDRRRHPDGDRAAAGRGSRGDPQRAVQDDPDAGHLGMNMLAIVDNRPEVLTLHDLLRHFLDHRKTVVVRRTRYDLRKAEERPTSSRACSRRSTTSTR
jgi:DNA gyrase subunit A